MFSAMTSSSPIRPTDDPEARPSPPARALQHDRAACRRVEPTMIRFKHILVPVDFEQSSRDALDVAVDLALTFDSKLTLLHSWESVAYAYATLPYVSADLSIAIEQPAKDQLETLRARAAERVPRVEVTLTLRPPAVASDQAPKDQPEPLRARVAERLPRVEVTLTRGPPAFDIVAVAERLKADLIVMGTHGRRGMSHVLLGSVAEKVVRCSPIPVLTIRGGAPVASKVSLRPAHAPA